MKCPSCGVEMGPVSSSHPTSIPIYCLNCLQEVDSSLGTPSQEIRSQPTNPQHASRTMRIIKQGTKHKYAISVLCIILGTFAVLSGLKHQELRDKQSLKDFEAIGKEESAKAWAEQARTGQPYVAPQPYVTPEESQQLHEFENLLTAIGSVNLEADGMTYEKMVHVLHSNPVREDGFYRNVAYYSWLFGLVHAGFFAGELDKLQSIELKRLEKPYSQVNSLHNISLCGFRLDSPLPPHTKKDNIYKYTNGKDYFFAHKDWRGRWGLFFSGDDDGLSSIEVSNRTYVPLR